MADTARAFTKQMTEDRFPLILPKDEDYRLKGVSLNVQTKTAIVLSSSVVPSFRWPEAKDDDVNVILNGGSMILLCKDHEEGY